MTSWPIKCHRWCVFVNIPTSSLLILSWFVTPFILTKSKVVHIWIYEMELYFVNEMGNSTTQKQARYAFLKCQRYWDIPTFGIIGMRQVPAVFDQPHARAKWTCTLYGLHRNLHTTAHVIKMIKLRYTVFCWTDPCILMGK